MILKVLSDKSLVQTVKSTLFQRESCVDNITIILSSKYKDQDMTVYTWQAEYIDPAGLAHIDLLDAEEELRDDAFIVLHFPVTSKFTYMAGIVTLKLTGTYVEEATDVVHTFKTGEIQIEVEKLNDYFVAVSPDTATEIDAKIAELKAQTDKLAELTELNQQKMAQDLAYTDTGHINLVNEDDIPMGEGVDVVHYAKNAPKDTKDDGEVDLDDVVPTPDEDITFIDLDG